MIQHDYIVTVQHMTHNWTTCFPPSLWLCMPGWHLEGHETSALEHEKCKGMTGGGGNRWPDSVTVRLPGNRSLLQGNVWNVFLRRTCAVTAQDQIRGSWLHLRTVCSYGKTVSGNFKSSREERKVPLLPTLVLYIYKAWCLSLASCWTCWIAWKSCRLTVFLMAYNEFRVKPSKPWN